MNNPLLTDSQQEPIENIIRLLNKTDDYLTYLNEYIDKNLNTKNEFWENNGITLKILIEELLSKSDFMNDYVHQQSKTSK